MKERVRDIKLSLVLKQFQFSQLLQIGDPLILYQNEVNESIHELAP